MRLVKPVYGRDLTDDEMDDFDPESIIGKQVDVLVEETPSKDGTVVYNNITSFSKTVKKLPAVENVMNTQAVVEKESVPAMAPKAENVDAFNEEMKQSGKVDKKAKEVQPEEDEEDVEVLEAKLKLAKAKARKAKKK